ncbi:DUF3726 domain-containing protein [Alisedimentitalea sp. MJ-SS2]|uniref:DUF3726 domain-containing protein n=1 Tax=Aliisedimentitalea sp. MJ-SS2 TaxID=3049795 RepID=UPI00290EFFAC|nr:DUF3726 domain-containing protein [Alisedimentitalea sp. MJ-SS2]MDU8927382.1 DUF3726 domain-containing protein [Alisedimentitalea sp. MJ-SS2]
MSFALNEVEVTAKKATRGAGYDWGLAEEAGKATRWLCIQGLDGPTLLASLLAAGYAGELSNHRPKTLAAPWNGAESLCPLITGSALSDCAATLPGEIGATTAPAILLPFVASAARQTGKPLQLSGSGFSAWTDGDALSVQGSIPAEVERLTLEHAGETALGNPELTRSTPDAAAWDTLNQFAHRIYAPATEESRLLGAGAGLTDND